MRKIVQIVDSSGHPFALCDDGTAWRYYQSHKWERLPPIPQDDEGDVVCCGCGALVPLASALPADAQDDADPICRKCAGVDAPAFDAEKVAEEIAEKMGLHYAVCKSQADMDLIAGDVRHILHAHAKPLDVKRAAEIGAKLASDPYRPGAGSGPEVERVIIEAIHQAQREAREGK